MISGLCGGTSGVKESRVSKQELLKAAVECLILARARITKVLNSTKESKARSDLFIALGRLNMVERIVEEVRSKLG